MRKLVIITLFVIIVGLINKQSKTINKSPSNKLKVTKSTTTEIPQYQIIAQNLDTPWGLVFLPDSSILVTERPGRIRLINKNGQLEDKPVAIISGAKEIGEGGLLGITIDPDFENNHYVYLYYTYSSSSGNTLNKVVRMNYQKNKLGNEKTLIDKIPGSVNHNGGRIKFGPDGYLYITTGDAQNPSQAQDVNSFAGKILWITNDGKVPTDNPFGNLVYTYGHRNPQGLAWDDQGNLWATEHGRSGILSGFDELNKIEKGKNYGWPDIEGDKTKAGMETAAVHSGSSTTWAPAGAAFLNNSIFFGGLRGATLYQAVFDSNKITIKEHFQGQFGRIRDVIVGPDNALYITTSNQDGRGKPDQADDRIIKINLERLQ